MTVARITKDCFELAEQLPGRRRRRPQAREARRCAGLPVIDIISGQTAKVKDGKVKEYRVTMNVAFVLDDD